jgi:uncharacterized delta-60 repeat protein
MTRRARGTTAVLAIAAATFAFGVPGASAAPGDLDRSFSGNGVVRTYNAAAGQALALQQNGRIVAVGTSEFGQAIEVVRYLRDGDLDPTFGNGGRASVLNVDGGDFIDVAAAGIDSVGRIVIAGTVFKDDPLVDIVIVRVLPGGDLDTSFGDQGIVLLNPGSNDGAVARLDIRPDDSVLVGGYVSNFRQDSAFIAARIDDQGDLDSSYGDGGTKIVPLGHRGRTGAMAVDGRGRATLAELFPGPNHAIRIIRLTRGGELDDSFSGDGRRSLDLGRREWVRTLAIGRHGRIFVGGSVRQRKPRGTSRTNLALARLKPNGSLDRRFGRRGIVTTDMDRFDYASDLAPQADGKMVVSGIATRFDPNNPQRWVVLRYRKNGRLDRSFSGNGRVRLTIIGSPPVMEMQPNGRILLLGWRWDDDADTEPHGFILARMRNDGRPLGG